MAARPRDACTLRARKTARGPVCVVVELQQNFSGIFVTECT
jgi:hypothetical protein